MPAQTLEEILARLDQVMELGQSILHMERIGGSQVVVTGLDEISDNLGLVKAGEFRSGKGTPGIDFTGVRIGAPGWLYSSKRYSIVGTNNEVLQFGLSNEDGAIYASAGKVTIGSTGITIDDLNTDEPADASLIFKNSGTQAGQITCYNDTGYGPSLAINVPYYQGLGSQTGIYMDIGHRIELQIQHGLDDNNLLGIYTDHVYIGGFNSTLAPIYFSVPELRVRDSLKVIRGTTTYTGYVFVPLTAYVTATAWDGDAKTTANNGVIDLQTVFGLPAGIKAVLCRMEISDETVDVFASLGPTASDPFCLAARTQVTNIRSSATGVIPCDANGDIWFYSTDELDRVQILVYGYWI